MQTIIFLVKKFKNTESAELWEIPINPLVPRPPGGE